jgi:hypothetical protein
LKINDRNAIDEDGLLLKDGELEYLEVAHIIPHALGSSNISSQVLVRFPALVYSKDSSLVCLRMILKHTIYKFSTCLTLALSA